MSMKIIALLLLANIYLMATEYIVITSHRNTISTLSPKQIKDIFLMKRHFINGKKIIPVNASSTQALRKAFEESILKTDREKLNRYWIKKHFQGISPPIVQSSENSIKAFVKNVDGAVGYIPRSQLDNSLKVLYEF